MKPYEWILFDADETLFEFDALRGLKLMFSRFSINFSDADFSEYQLVNKPLWVQYQNGEISATQLQYQRFQSWLNGLMKRPKH